METQIASQTINKSKESTNLPVVGSYEWKCVSAYQLYLPQQIIPDCSTNIYRYFYVTEIPSFLFQKMDKK